MDIRLISSVIFVKDIRASRRFYEDVLNQKVLIDHGPNIGFEGGFGLWQRDHASQIIFQRTVEDPSGNMDNAELYFETDQLDLMYQRLETAGVRFIHPLTEQPWGQRVVRFYDLDGHIVELGEPMPVVIARFLAQGLSMETIAQRTAMPLAVVQQMAAANPA